MELWYDRAAIMWTDALPVGNGRLGAMMFGGIEEEHMALNEDTLWSGYPRDWNNPQAREALAEIRSLIAAQRYEEAERLSKARMMGPYTQSYMPLADWRIRLFHGHFVRDYERWLDLETACAGVSYTVGGARYTRELFASAPDDVLVLRMTCSEPGRLQLRTWLSSPLRSGTSWSDAYYAVSGDCPYAVTPSYVADADPVKYEPKGSSKTLQFEGRLQCRTDADARVRIDHDGIHVEGATEVVFFFAAGTSFAGFNKMPDAQAFAPDKRTESALQQAMQADYATLKQRHLADYQHLFQRVQLRLGAPHDEKAQHKSASGIIPGKRRSRPTTLERMREPSVSDSHLTELLFQYGRYLLIASSRPGTQPANLQGIWNPHIRPIWSCNYTLNINLQMNYWLAESTNLSECHQPLLDFIKDLSINGEKTAQVNYGCRGWTSHHNSDIWRQSAPPGNDGNGNPLWANWPMAGVWLCQHLWEHYLYTGDLKYLAETYPIMRKAAEFCLDWVQASDSDAEGRTAYHTCPSTSPEHRFRLTDGRTPALTVSSTMDISLIRELFAHCLEAASVLDIQEEYRDVFAEVLAGLPDVQVGARGQIQEWFYDFDDEDPQHRHLSHLYGLYPGALWDGEQTNKLLDAARQTLEQRGDGGTGWSIGWKIALWARLQDGNRAHRIIMRMLNLVEDDGVMDFERGGVYSNMLVAHPPFQIDGNFGASAAIAEMLLQSHNGQMTLLPALPDAWPTGSVSGLKGRGGYTVDIEWTDGQLQTARITAQRAGNIQVRSGQPFRLREQGGKWLNKTASAAQFLEAGPGLIYEVVPAVDC